MLFRALLPIIFLALTCQSSAANKMKAPNTPKNPNVSAGINANLKHLYRAKKQLELSQTLTSKLHQIRNTQNESFSKILQQAYQLERGKMPSKVKIQELDTFLRQVIKFRNADKQLSTKTVNRLIKANKSFDGLKQSPDGLHRFTSEIKNWDKARIETTKIYSKVNGIRTKLGYAPLEPYKVKVVRRIATNDYRFLLEDSIRQKQDITRKLLDSKTYKSKVEIQRAILNKEPAVKELAHLNRRIRFLDMSLKENPLRQSRFKANKAHQKVTNFAKNTKIAQKGISFLNKMPANSSMLDALRAQRLDVYNQLKASGEYKTWRQIKTALKDPKVNNSKIIELRQIDTKIQKARFDIKMSRLPLVSENKLFANRWEKLNNEILRLKTLKRYARTDASIKPTHLNSLKLTQRSLYMEQASIRLKHSLLSDKTYSSPQQLTKALKNGNFQDPRMSSLARLETDLTKVQSKITRSVSGKVGYITRLYNEAKTTGKIAGKGKQLAQSAKDSAKLGADKIAQRYIDTTSQIKQQSKELFVKSKDGLVRVKSNLETKGARLYKSSKNGAVKAIQGSRSSAANLYVKTKNGLSKATHNTLQSGVKIYTAGSTGVKKAGGILIAKGNDLYLVAKDGLARAQSNSVKSSQRYYQVAKNGSAKVINTLGKAGGELWIKTNEGLSRATRSSLKQGTQLYRLSKSGLVDANNTIIEKSGKLYRSSRRGLTRVQDAAKARGSHIYKAAKNGVFRAGKTITANSSELYLKTQQGFRRATRSTLTEGAKVYNLGKNGLGNARNILVEKAGKLYTNGKNGLSQLQKTSVQEGAKIYRTAKNGVINNVRSTGQQINGIYTKGKNGFVQATKSTISKGTELYSIGKNGIQNVSRSALRKAGGLYSLTSNGISRATAETIKSGARVYQFSKNGFNQVKSGLVDTSGKLYQTSKNGLTRATKVSAQQAGKLFSATKDGSIRLTKAGIGGTRQLYTAGKDGLVRATQSSIKAGNQLYTMGKNGIVKASNYVGGRIRMGQLNAGHQWIMNGNSSNAGFLGNNYKPSSPNNTPLKVSNISNSSNSKLMARMNLLNNHGSNTVRPAPISNPQPPNASGPKPGNGNPTSGKQGVVWDKVKNSAWGKQTSQTGKELAKSIGNLKGKSPTEVVKHVKNVGNKVVDKTLAPNGYEVKRDAIAVKIQAKVSQLNLDIANARANNQPKKAAKLEALRTSLQGEYQKSQIGPQGAQLQAQIKAIGDQINNLKNNGGSKADIKALKQIQNQKQQSLKEIQGNKPNSAKAYVRDGLRFAVISAATQGILNLVEQVKSGDEVNVGNAFNFITSPEFVMGTSGAFAGGLIVQKTMASGFGKIMMHSVMNVIPGGPFVKSVVSVLPYTLGAMVGSDLLTGNLGQRGIGETLASGIGSSVGMMLGSALFPPVGSIAGAVLGGMIADSLFKSFGAGDNQELAVRMLYEPQWIEFNELAYTDQDTSELQATMQASEEEFQAWMKPFLDGLTSIEELEQAKADTYQRYTNAVNDHGPDHPNTKNSYRLYQEISQRIEEARQSGEFSIEE